MTISMISFCAICKSEKKFTAIDDYYSCRSSLKSPDCQFGGCATRERAISKVITSFYSEEQLKGMLIHESSPALRGLSLWLFTNCRGYIPTGYFPDKLAGEYVGKYRNENLEQQTFADASLDLVVHLDVLEHLFNPFAALADIFRTLKPGGRCIFTAPTYPNREKSEQVSFNEPTGLRIIGEPEYHGNPQHPENGALVTWRYGYDLPLRISRETNFDVEVRRWQSKSDAVLGPMTEVYILNKPA
jgi:hypothetical protein